MPPNGRTLSCDLEASRGTSKRRDWTDPRHATPCREFVPAISQHRLPTDLPRLYVAASHGMMAIIIIIIIRIACVIFTGPRSYARERASYGIRARRVLPRDPYAFHRYVVYPPLSVHSRTRGARSRERARVMNDRFNLAGHVQVRWPARS